jgi:hypothetical protein
MGWDPASSKGLGGITDQLIREESSRESPELLMDKQIKIENKKF